MRSEREVLDSVRQIAGFPSLRDDLKIADARPDGDMQLMRVDHAWEQHLPLLTNGCLGQEVIVLRKEYPSELRCSVKQVTVACLACSVFECRDHVHIPQTQPRGYGARHMVIHVELDAH